MKNLFINTEFLLGVTNYKYLPDDQGYEILLAGRSNAGKSSALNALTENPKLARISKTPGRTTEINFFKVNDEIKLVDLPGYGFAKSPKSKKKDWGPLLHDYFKKRKALTVVTIFMDIRHPLKEIDQQMIKLCISSNVAFIPVLTKADKISRNKVNQSKQSVIKKLPNCNPIAISVLNKTGIDLLRKEILKYCDA